MRLAIIGVLAICACSEPVHDPRGEPPPESMTVPPPPPRESKMVEPSGAILTLPEPDWQFLEGAAVTRLDPGAVLGMRRDDNCLGFVAVSDKVEPSPRPAALRMLEVRKAAMTWDVHVDEDVLYAAHTARRWEIQRAEGDTKISERTSMLVEGPRLFALHALARDPDYGRRRRCLDQITAGFDLRMWEPPEGAPGSQGSGDAQP